MMVIGSHVFSLVHTCVGFSIKAIQSDHVTVNIKELGGEFVDTGQHLFPISLFFTEESMHLPNTLHAVSARWLRALRCVTCTQPRLTVSIMGVNITLVPVCMYVHTYVQDLRYVRTYVCTSIQ